jgi:hypothetical protein
MSIPTTNSRKGKGQKYWKQRAHNNFIFWKPIIFGVLTYTEAAEGDPELLFEAGGAVDLKIEFENKRYKKMMGKK